MVSSKNVLKFSADSRLVLADFFLIKKRADFIQYFDAMYVLTYMSLVVRYRL